MLTTRDSLEGSISRALPEGRSTLMPERFSTLTASSLACERCCSSRMATAAQAMKMISMTRNTSVSGVMLISEKIGSSEPPSTSASGCFPRAMPLAVLVGVAAGERARLLLGAGTVLVEQLEELVGHHAQLDRGAGQPLVEEVVEDDRLDGDEDTGGGGIQRHRDAARDHVEAALLDLLQLGERVDDAEHGAEQTDERRDDADGGQDPQVVLERGGHLDALAVDRRLQVLLLGAAQPLVADQVDVGQRRLRALARRAALL